MKLAGSEALVDELSWKLVPAFKAEVPISNPPTKPAEAVILPEPLKTRLRSELAIAVSVIVNPPISPDSAVI